VFPPHTELAGIDGFDPELARSALGSALSACGSSSK
jgi:hypothetical protein